MVYEWGRLPDKGYKEEISDEEELHKGDLVFIEWRAKRRTTYPGGYFEKLPSEKEMADKIMAKTANEGHSSMYIRVVRTDVTHTGPLGLPLIESTYHTEHLIHILHDSPLTLAVLFTIVVVAGVIGWLLTLYSPVFFKWAGLSPEEVSKYIGGILPGLDRIVIIFVAIVAILFLIWYLMGRRRRRR